MSLNRAAKEGNVAEIKKLLKEGHQPNQYKNLPPIMDTVIGYARGNMSLPICLKIIDLLMDSGANINAKARDGWTVLHLVSEIKNPYLVEALLKRKADVNALNNINDTPLHVAVLKLNADTPKESIFKTTQHLLEYGANINALNAMELSPYFIATSAALKTLLSQYGTPRDPSRIELSISHLHSLFPPAIKEIKPLTELAAKVAIENKSFIENKSKFFSQLKHISDDLKSKFPELELDPMKRFIHKIEQLINRLYEKFKPETHQQELQFLSKIYHALSEKNPYNEINKLTRELDSAMKKVYLSTFTDNMRPVRKQIVTMLKEYNSDKLWYADQMKAEQNKKLNAKLR